MYKEIDRLLVLQGIVGLTCVVVFLLVREKEACSAFLAVVAVLLPNVVFGFQMRDMARPSEDVAHSIYRIIFTMLNITIVMFAFDVQPLGFFVAMILMQLTFLLDCQRKAN